MKYNTSSRGFTLVELLIVIAIIAILTGIVITSLTSSKAKSRDAQRVSDTNQLQLALEQFFDRCGFYPAADAGGGPSTSDSCTSGGVTVTINTFLAKIPHDPSTAQSYGYVVNSTKTDFVVSAKLEGQNQIQQNSYSQTAFTSNFGSSNNYSGGQLVTCYDSTGSKTSYCVSTK